MRRGGRRVGGEEEGGGLNRTDDNYNKQILHGNKGSIMGLVRDKWSVSDSRSSCGMG